MLNTYEQLELLKQQEDKDFGNKYLYFIEELTHNYISKIIGIDIVKCELSKWDEESKEIIFDDLLTSVIKMNLINFDPQLFKNEILGND